MKIKIMAYSNKYYSWLPISNIFNETESKTILVDLIRGE